ncbi:WhiB family transcriptional regulator [Streptomyces sp. NPDC056716]
MREGSLVPRSRGNQSWQEKAACSTAVEAARDLDLFFPERGDEQRIRLAKVICSSCAVRETCLEAALESGDSSGIRGGLTETELVAARADFEQRCDPARVSAALDGRDVHLSTSERQELIRRAVQIRTPALLLARALKVSEAHAEKLVRQGRRSSSTMDLRNPVAARAECGVVPA